MWTCPNCKRIFERTKQQHSCNTIPLEQHFKNKDLAKELFNYLLNEINTKVGPCKVISIPCCIHLFGDYDFLVALPHKDRLEIRFASIEKITSPRITQSVSLSQKSVKFCLDIKNIDEIDTELLNWIEKSYFLKDVF